MSKNFNDDIIEIDIDNFLITFSKEAIKIIYTSIVNKNRKNKILRISVEGGGCSGFKYGLNFINTIDDNDILCNYTDKIKIVVDINSYSCMKNTTIDFMKTDRGSGFTFNNPNYLDSCNGCD